MTFTVRELVTASYYLSGIVARRLQTPTGQQITDGVKLLNALLAIKTANNRLIPYYEELVIDGVIGQERYFVENLISVETLTFNIGDVRYSMVSMDRVTYFGSPRVNNISSLPYSYFVERCKGGSNIYLYFSESGEYPLTMHGKFSLGNVTLDQDLDLTLDKYYIEYLRFALAEYICTDFNLSLPPQSQAKLNEYEAIITDISPMDLVIQKVSTMDKSNVMNYAFANFNTGWIP